jgi:RHS repeat-associated protein
VSVKPGLLPHPRTQDRGSRRDARHRALARVRAITLLPHRAPEYLPDIRLRAQHRAARAAGQRREGLPGQRRPSMVPLSALPAGRAEGLLSQDLPAGAYSARYDPDNYFQINPTYQDEGVINVRVTNTSSVVWPANSVGLSYHLYRQPFDLYAFDGLKRAIPYDVAPGTTVSMPEFVQTLPAGNFVIYFDLVDLTADGLVFFSQRGVPASAGVPFTVPHYAPSASQVEPLVDATVDALTPRLRAVVQSDQTHGVEIQFEACRDPDGNSCTGSGWQSVPLNPEGGFTAIMNWTIPFGVLPTWNQPYYWRIAVHDTGTVAPPWSSLSRFYPVVAPADPSHRGFDPAALDGAGVNIYAGSYTRDERDLTEPGPQGSVPLQIERVYNSSNSTSGAFGIGWSSLLDVTMNDSSVGCTTFETVTLPDGRQARYGKNVDGTFASAYGEDSSASLALAPSAVLDFGGGTRYLFNAAVGSTRSLAGIGAPDGDALTLARSGGQVTQLTDRRSSRSLYLTWSGGHVTAVSTAPAGSTGALTWTYGYLGDLLTQVCDPDRNCSTYSYGEAGPVTFNADPNECLDVAGGNPIVGQRVQLWDCNGGAGQQWAAYPDATLRAFGMCLDVIGNATASGSKVQLWYCDRAGGQQWQVRADGSIMNPQSGRCLDSPGATTTAGAWLQIWDCNATPAQIWTAPTEAPRLTAMQAPVTVNVTTVDYASGIVTRVGDRWNNRSYPNSWYYGRQSVDPEQFDGKTLIVQITDPRGVNVWYDFGPQGQLIDRFVGGRNTQPRHWAHDTLGRVAAMIDENENLTEYFWDSQTQMLSHINRYRDGTTVINTDFRYLGDGQHDPRFGRLPTRIADPSGHATTMTYRNGLLITTTTPPTAAAPNGATTTDTYTCDGGAQPPPVVNDPGAPSGARQPCGLLATVTDPDGRLTNYAYNRYGDRTVEITPSGRRSDSVFDAVGRMTSQALTSSSNPSGSFTRYTYDGEGRVKTETDQLVVNPITGQSHGLLRTNTYDGDGNLTEQLFTDQNRTNPDPPRDITYTYDNHDYESSESRSGQLVSRTEQDAMGHVTRSFDADNAEFDYVYGGTGQLRIVKLMNFVDDPSIPTAPRVVFVAQHEYDAAGRLASSANALGQTVTYTYTGDDLMASETLVGSTSPGGPFHDTLLHRYDYDLAGNLIEDTQGADPASARVTDYAYDANNERTSVSFGSRRVTTTTSYDPAGLMTGTSTTSRDGGIGLATINQYDSAGQLIKTAVRNGGQDLVTQYTRDGLLALSRTDPRGASAIGSGAAGDPAYTTTNTYDALGQLSSTAEPPVLVQDGTGSGAHTARPTTTYGYDTYGDITQVRDPRGDVTSTGYDNRGRRIDVYYPTYRTPSGAYLTPHGGWGYDNADNVTSYTDARGSTTTAAYDLRSRPYRITLPRATSDGAPGTLRITHDDDGNVLSMTDPVGAQTLQTFDGMDRRTTSVQVVRNGTVNPDRYTTHYGYNDFGELTSASTDGASGAGYQAQYDVLGQKYQQSLTGDGSTRYAYNAAGKVTSVTDALGRRVSMQYDDAQRLIWLDHYDADGRLVDTAHYFYDAAGNMTVAAEPGQYWQATYDAANRVASRSDPPTTDPDGNPTGTPTTTFGYDENGNQTRLTDANHNTTWQTYQAWDLPETRTEPATAANPALADRTWTDSYDVGGAIASMSEPGGVVRTTAYDLRGRLIGVGASGGDASAFKSFGYDQDGRLTSAGAQSFGYDDRGLLTSSSGPQGSATFGYDPMSRLSSESDAAGTLAYTYDGVDTMASATDSLSGATRTFTHDAAGQVVAEHDTVAGVAGASRAFGYDGEGRLSAEYFYGPSGPPTATLTNTWGRNGNLAATATSGTLGDVTKTYTYDEDNRLTRYQRTSGSTTTGQDYSWDLAGNRTAVASWSGAPAHPTASRVATYDQRDRIVATTGTDGTTSYSWTPRGTLASTTHGSATTVHKFDAFDRLIAQSSRSYTYDDLDRLATATGGSGSNTFRYAGLSAQPVSDGQTETARTPGGPPVADRPSSGGSARNLVEDAHGDVFAATGIHSGAITQETSFNPFGQAETNTGAPPSTGYQDSWTDPTTQQDAAGTRWYSPSTGTFMSHDSIAAPALTGNSANPYLYGAANPSSNSDQSGLFTIGSFFEGAVGEIVAGAEGLLAEAAPAAAEVAGAGVGTLLGAGALIVGSIVVVAVGGYLIYEMVTADGGLDPISDVPDEAAPPAPANQPARVAPAPRAALQPGTAARQVAAPHSAPPRSNPVPAPFITGTQTVTTTHYWQGPTIKWWDDTYLYIQTDHYSQDQFDRDTYYSNGRTVHNRWFGAVIDDPQTVVTRLIDPNNLLPAAPTPVPPPQAAPGTAAAAPTDGVCAVGSSVSGCAPTSALPPDATSAEGGRHRTDREPFPYGRPGEPKHAAQDSGEAAAPPDSAAGTGGGKSPTNTPPPTTNDPWGSRFFGGDDFWTFGRKAGRALWYSFIGYLVTLQGCPALFPAGTWQLNTCTAAGTIGWTVISAFGYPETRLAVPFASAVGLGAIGFAALPVGSFLAHRGQDLLDMLHRVLNDFFGASLDPR